MVDPWIAGAVVLLAVGVAGSIVPLLPGPLFSLAGVYGYWWHTGYTEPEVLPLVGLTLLGVIAFVTEQFAGSVAAKAGGASWLTTVVSAVVGVVLFIVTATGPIGLIVGIVGTVFAVEFYRSRDAAASLRAAGYTTLGMLGSTLIQTLLTATMLVAFLLAVGVL